MRLYDMTVTMKSGKSFTLHRRDEQSNRSLTAFFQGYGDTVESKEVGFQSDRPVYRWTEEGELVRNV